MARLLTKAELPGKHWRVLSQRTWATGTIGPPTAWGERARQQGSVTAWRSFRNIATKRGAWIQIAQLASPADAEDSLNGIWDRMLPNPAAKVRLVSEVDVPLERFPGCSAVRAREQRTEGYPGSGEALLLVSAVDDWLMVLALYGTPAWDWPAATALATRQAAHLSG